MLGACRSRMGLELQYDGMQRGYELGYPSFNSPASALDEYHFRAEEQRPEKAVTQYYIAEEVG